MHSLKMNILFCFLAPLVLAAFSAERVHASFSQPASAVSGGGGYSSSPRYINRGIIAQPVIIDSSASSGYSTDHGFLPVLGGWRILYPVISATPGIITFTLAPNAGDSQSLAIANTGGSTLMWTVTKGNTGESYFTISPGSGIGNGSINVTANAAGLMAGNYSDTLTISGAGISRTVQVQLNLTVTEPSAYRLTVTVLSDTAGKGGGLVYSDGGAINCSGTGTTGTICHADFSPGTTVTLYQSPDSNSTWASWNGPCSVIGNDCKVTVNGLVNVTATFPYAHMAKVKNSGALYDALQPAIDSASAYDAVYCRDVTFNEDISLRVNKVLSLLGGLSPWYLPQNAWTTLHGTLTIQSGQLTVDRLVVK